MGDLDLTALAAEEVVEGLKKIYKKNVLPLEQAYKYDLFFSLPMQDVDFEAKPMILVLGQYSTGKTTFIRHLIGRDFPGMRIGPEPTTDKFTAVFYGPDDQIIPGHSLSITPDLPFRNLNQFGTHFMNKFEGSVCSSNALKSFMFIDSPGVLSGKKQTVGRQYDYDSVVDWFATRADRILLLFDCSKLDISDEFKKVISTLRVHDEKIRVILNKADSITEKELIHVYGALMWSLGKVFRTPEVLRVYISSFSDKPLDERNYCYPLFKGDHAAIIGELKSLPRQSAMQKINELLKRARLVKVHAQIMSELRSDMPKFFGKNKKQKQIVEELPDQFRKIARKIGVPPSDFPNLQKFKEVLEEEDISKYPKTNQSKIQKLDVALEKLIPELVKKLNDKTLEAHKTDGATNEQFNPFEREQQEEQKRRDIAAKEVAIEKEREMEKQKAKEDSKSSRLSFRRTRPKSMASSKSGDSKGPLDPARRQLQNTMKTYNQYRQSGAMVGRRIKPITGSRQTMASEIAQAKTKEDHVTFPKSNMQQVEIVDGIENIHEVDPEHNGSSFDDHSSGEHHGATNSQNQNVPRKESKQAAPNVGAEKVEGGDDVSNNSKNSRLRLASNASHYKARLVQLSRPEKDASVKSSWEGGDVPKSNTSQNDSAKSSPKQNLKYLKDVDVQSHAPAQGEFGASLYRRSARMLPRESNATNEWVVSMVDKTESDNIFYQQRLLNNKLTGKAAKKAFSSLGLSNEVLNKIWVLVDIEKTNELDSDQFALAVYISKRFKTGEAIPEKLTWQMIPPSHREV